MKLVIPKMSPQKHIYMYKRYLNIHKYGYLPVWISSKVYLALINGLPNRSNNTIANGKTVFQLAL